MRFALLTAQAQGGSPGDPWSSPSGNGECQICSWGLGSCVSCLGLDWLGLLSAGESHRRPLGREGGCTKHCAMSTRQGDEIGHNHPQLPRPTHPIPSHPIPGQPAKLRLLVLFHSRLCPHARPTWMLLRDTTQALSPFPILHLHLHPPFPSLLLPLRRPSCIAASTSLRQDHQQAPHLL